MNVRKIKIFKREGAMISIADCNPYLRAAEIQPAVLEGDGPRRAYDHRLFYVLDGRGTLVIEGKEHALTPDTLLLWTPNIDYHFRGKMRVVVLNFDVTRAASGHRKPMYPPPVAEFHPEKIPNGETLAELGSPLVLGGSAHLRAAVLEIAEVFHERGVFADADTSAQLKRVLVDAVRLTRLPPDAREQLVSRLLSHIRLHAPTITDNAALAAAFGYHPVYLATVFREVTGKGLHQAIVEERIRLACKWLRQTDRTVEQIAYDTGFSSRSHFSTAFRAQMGVSPREFRGRGKLQFMG